MGYDALLWLSFGGPEGPDEVMPFLENVTRGRGVPASRLTDVAQHYHHFGGVSPINQLNRDAIGTVRAEMAAQDVRLPVYLGNRNWHPLLEATLAEMARDGIRRALVFPTSAYGGYSACRQYDEDIERARTVVGPDAPELTKLRQFFDHPLFIGACADAVRAAHRRLAGVGPVRTVFVAHSIPDSADRAAGPPASGGRRYSRQIAEAARLVSAQVGIDSYDVVWQSRSGPPSMPWLAPDIVDHLDTVRADGFAGVVVCPVGFVSDHLEVVWDLDNEVAQRAGELGMAFARAATAGSHPCFPELVVELIREHVTRAPVRKLSAFPAAGETVNGQPCADGCCLREGAHTAAAANVQP